MPKTMEAQADLGVCTFIAIRDKSNYIYDMIECHDVSLDWSDIGWSQDVSTGESIADLIAVDCNVSCEGEGNHL